MWIDTYSKDLDMNVKSNVDIILLTHNTRSDLLDKSLTCLVGLDNFILIVDDHSCDEFYNHLIKKATSLKNYKIVRTDTNIRQYNATYYGLQFLNNDFIMRLDDDDEYFNIPVWLDPNIDFYAKRIHCKNIDDWLELKPMRVSGSIIKTNLMKEMYSYGLSNNEYQYFHEDVYATLILFLKYSSLNFKKSNFIYKYNKRKDSESSKVQQTGKKYNRLSLLYHTCIKLGISSEVYNKYAKKIIKD